MGITRGVGDYFVALMEGAMWGCNWQAVIRRLCEVRFPVQVRYVRWVRPAAEVLKVNFDGSIITHSQAGGRGVLRDSKGWVIFVYSEPYRNVTSLQAEARALCMGLELCNLFRHGQVLVEGDSKILIDALQGYGVVPVSLLAILRHLRQLSPAISSCQHIHREGNFVADSLASLGSRSDKFCLFLSFTSLPRSVRGLCQVDRLGVGHFRFSKRSLGPICRSGAVA
ncbi:uncharacterized protein [Coffea arabica]|uniref:RNase H type-1 domain-containing protein n=1 Tax=Coffea arabica TaxID=13443 RepID=A0A6P6TV95_COFAR|nr:uncharacterized protein LOC113704607 [Coffea arabica]